MPRRSHSRNRHRRIKQAYLDECRLEKTIAMRNKFRTVSAPLTLEQKELLLEVANHRAREKWDKLKLEALNYRRAGIGLPPEETLPPGDPHF